LALAVAAAFVSIVLFKLPRRRAIVWVVRCVFATALLVLSVLEIAAAFPAGVASLTAVELVAAGAVISALIIDELIGRDVRSALERLQR
jgi:hypothetical protein